MPATRSSVWGRTGRASQDGHGVARTFQPRLFSEWEASPCRGADSPPLAVSMRADPANPAIMHPSYLKNVALWLPNLVDHVILGKMPVGEFFMPTQCYTPGAV